LNIITFFAAGILLASQNAGDVGGGAPPGGFWVLVPALEQPASRTTAEKSAAVNVFEREFVKASSGE
jgi:hypothetical protein